MGATPDQRGEMYDEVAEFLEADDGDPSEVVDIIATIIEHWEEPEREQTAAAAILRGAQRGLEDIGL